MDALTFSDTVKLLESCGFRHGTVYDMIAHKQLYSAVRTIPYDSFARFLDYNPIYRDAFYDYEPGDDCYMQKVKERTLEYINKSFPIYEEDYTLAQIEKIFDVNRKAIRNAIRKEPHPWRFWFRKNFSAVEILIYLKNHPNALERLKDRQAFLLSSGSIYEAPVRHIIMLYSYYEGYGYIV